jgi:hypothetical protein
MGSIAASSFATFSFSLAGSKGKKRELMHFKMGWPHSSSQMRSTTVQLGAGMSFLGSLTSIKQTNLLLPQNLLLV